MKPPKEIDLSIIPPPSTAELTNDIVKTIVTEPSGDQGEAGSQPAETAAFTKALVAIANQSWRISNVVIDPASKEPKEKLLSRDIKKMNNALESIEVNLKTLGIDLKDRLGEPFDVGLPYQVMTEHPQGGISKEHVIKTIEPTIFWNQIMVQRGKIDIAVSTEEK